MIQPLSQAKLQRSTTCRTSLGRGAVLWPLFGLFQPAQWAWWVGKAASRSAIHATSTGTVLMPRRCNDTSATLHVSRTTQHAPSAIVIFWSGIPYWIKPDARPETNVHHLLLCRCGF